MLNDKSEQKAKKLGLENEHLKNKVEELNLKVTELDVGLTIVKEKSLDMPLLQVTERSSITSSGLGVGV